MSVPVAQRIERLPSKQRVVGSIPAWDAIIYICWAIYGGNLVNRFGPTVNKSVNNSYVPLIQILPPRPLSVDL